MLVGMPPSDEVYADAGARYYDAVYAVLRAGSGDVDFYRSLARQARGPVLELGCGSGRVLLPIAHDGWRCVGLDASPAMLARLSDRSPPPNLRLVRGRMERFDLDGDRFALIFSAFRAFQHLLTVEDQLSCLDAVRRHLLPGGLFAFDVFAPRLERTAAIEEPEAEDACFTQNGMEIARFASVRRDPARQTMDVTFRYERRAPGAPSESEVVTTRMRWFFRYELEHLLARAGFASIEVFGGFDRRPYDYFSGETVVIAKVDS
jgi:SAM-dependent methyltransferase